MNIPLVFVHGWGLNSTMWNPLISELKSYDCHTIDLGFLDGGQTSWQEWGKACHCTSAILLGSLWLLKGS